MVHYYLLASVFLPLAGSLFICFFRGKARSGWAVMMTAASFVFTGLLLPSVLYSQAVEIIMPVFGSGFFTLSFIGDGIAIVFAFVFSLLSTVAILYSIEYIKKYKNQTEYFFMTTLMAGSLMGLAFSRNLILLYIFWEIATIATWRLVGFYRGNEHTAIANKTIIMIFAGSSFMLLGFIMIYVESLTFDLVSLRAYSPNWPALFLILIGILTKAAVIPFHNWLPDAHTAAPSPVSALLSGIVVKMGVLVYIRIFWWTFHVAWDWILILAIISSIVAASAALLEKDMKKIIAYSTVSQIGFMFLGFSILNEIGLIAGLLYLMVHAVGKAGLFLCAGIVEHLCGERNIDKLGGLLKVMPITGTAFAFCALTIIGMPPFGGFFSKLLILHAVTEKGDYWIAVLAVIAAVLTLLYFFRLFAAVFLGELKQRAVNENVKVMTGCALFLGLSSMAIGLFIKHILGFITFAVKGVWG